MIFSAVIRAVSGLITPAPPIFILSNNHTIVLSHDISCVCMHPAVLPLLHLIGRAACAIVADRKESGHSRKAPDFKGFFSLYALPCDCIKSQNKISPFRGKLIQAHDELMMNPAIGELSSSCACLFSCRKTYPLESTGSKRNTGASGIGSKVSVTTPSSSRRSVKTLSLSSGGIQYSSPSSY